MNVRNFPLLPTITCWRLDKWLWCKNAKYEHPIWIQSPPVSTTSLAILYQRNHLITCTLSTSYMNQLLPSRTHANTAIKQLLQDKEAFVYHLMHKPFTHDTRLRLTFPHTVCTTQQHRSYLYSLFDSEQHSFIPLDKLQAPSYIRLFPHKSIYNTH